MNEKKEVTKGNINRKRTYQYLSTLWQNVKRKKKYILLYIIIAIIVHMLIDYLATQNIYQDGNTCRIRYIIGLLI